MDNKGTNSNNEVLTNNVSNDTNSTPNVVTNEVNSNVSAVDTQTVTPNKDTKVKPVRYHKRPNIIFLIIIVAVIGVIGYIFASKQGLIGPNKQNSEYVAVNVDTGFFWADNFADPLQELYKKVQAFDVTFIDFMSDGTPEAIVQYKNVLDETETVIYSLNNGQISNTKVFKNCKFRLLKDMENNDRIDWFIYIFTDKKYGAYTNMEKILSGAVKDSDIKTYNDKEIASFNNRYVLSNYDQKYYQVKSSNFVDDYKTAVNKYKKYSDDVSKAKKELKEKEDKIPDIKPEDPEENKPYLNVGAFHLTYGVYRGKVTVFENGQEAGEKEVFLELKRNGVIIYDEEVINYRVANSSLILSNNVEAKVDTDDAFRYGNKKQAIIFEYVEKSSE